jgi:hypothetical protein
MGRNVRGGEQRYQQSHGDTLFPEPEGYYVSHSPTFNVALRSDQEKKEKGEKRRED